MNDSSAAEIKQHPIAVLGAGSWGTAVAIHLQRNGNLVSLWGRSADQVNLMRSSRVNQKYLPSIKIPDQLELHSHFGDCINQTTDLVIAVPSPQFDVVLHQLKPHYDAGARFRLLWLTKGLAHEPLSLLSERVACLMSPTVPMAVLSGPSFAKEVALGCTTSVTVAGNDDAWCQDVVARFHHAQFRVYVNQDLVGVQLCSVMKNVLAVAVGIADGMELGANSRAALITRGLAEMSRLLTHAGAKQSTLMGLAGIGDIVLTCTDNQSRNRRFGLALGRGASVKDAKAEVGHEVEGFNNVKQLFALAEQYEVEMPIVEQLCLYLHDEITLPDVLENLLARSPKGEF